MGFIVLGLKTRSKMKSFAIIAVIFLAFTVIDYSLSFKNPLENDTLRNLKFQNFATADGAMGTFDTIWGFVEDAYPYVSAVGRAISMVMSLFHHGDSGDATAIEKLKEEMEREFAEVHRRLDVIEMEMDNMAKEIITEIQKSDYNNQVHLKIVQLQDAWKRYMSYPSPTFKKELIRHCVSVNPSDIIAVVHDMVNGTGVSETFLAAIFAQAAYGQKVWLAWTAQIANDFLQAMTMEQICLTVEGTPTQADIDFLGNYSMKILNDVMGTLEAKWRIIDRDWPEKGVDVDVKEMLEKMINNNPQDIVDTIQAFLTYKYTAYFSVYITPGNSKILGRVFDPRKVRKVQYDKFLVFVTWNQEAYRGRAPGDHAANISRIIDTYECSKDTGGEMESFFVDYLLEKNKDYFNEVNFDVVYFMIPSIPCGFFTITTKGNYTVENAYLFEYNSAKTCCHCYCFYAFIGF